MRKPKIFLLAIPGEENRERMKEQIAGEYINGWMKLWINKLMVPWWMQGRWMDGWMPR